MPPLDDDAWETESDGEDLEDEDGQDVVIPPLLPVPKSLVKPNDRLCDVCKALQLTPKWFVVGDELDKPDDDAEIQLGLVQDIKKKSYCPFCRLVLAAVGSNVPTSEAGEPVSIAMSWTTDGPELANPWQHTPQIRLLSPRAQRPGGRSVDTQLNLFSKITLLANDVPTDAPSQEFFVRPIGDKIDFAMVRNWLLMCKQWHGKGCKQSKLLDYEVEDPAAEIPCFRLIDVVNNCIVSAPHNCQYVVLSYVWGSIDPTTILRTLKANVVELEKHGSLVEPENHDRIPLTIRDAMEAVRELHLRYLWVDSLCIIQDDVGEGGSKMDAISKMDIVYGAAYLTIMAATGGDANAGLPGLRPGTRKITQPVEQLLPGLRLAYRAKHHDYIESAIYYTRAWTFQEQMFTRRSLLFIGGQVVYRCMQTDQWREDQLSEGRRVGGSSPVNRDHDDIGNFEGLIQSYSGLSLTYPEDIYDAFAGITRYFKTALEVNLCHGIPDAYFDWFLLWTPLAPQKRREITPSWSWSGWTDQSWPHMWDWYERRIKSVRKAQRKRTWVIWYQRKAHNSTECVKVWQHSSSSSSPRNFYGGKIQNRFPLDCSRTLPTQRTLVKAPEYIKDSHNPAPGSGFLQFWTVSATFKVGRPTSQNTDPVPLKGCYRLGIFGHNGHELGTFIVNPDWPGAKLDQKSCEFILLCEGRDARAEDGRTDDEDGWRYKVMLIEWHDGEWAERVAVGSIGKDDLKQALQPGPVWKEIILG